MDIFVFSDSQESPAELLAGATDLASESGGSVAAIMVGPESEVDKAAAQGAETVYWLGEPEDRMIDDYVPTIIRLIEEKNPAALLISATVRGRAVAGRVAAAFDTTAITGSKDIGVSGGILQATHMVLGGNVLSIDRACGDLLVATIGAGVFSQVENVQSRGQVEAVPFVEPATGVTKLASRPKKSGGSDIATAKRVVGVGRGFAAKEDIALAKELADVLDGEVGYTRPVTEGNPPFVEGEPYIGVSGIQIRPELYIAAGVSGQTQHTVGVNDSKTIVCINSDPNSLMFRYSDYGIVGDLYEVLPVLTQTLKELQK